MSVHTVLLGTRILAQKMGLRFDHELHFDHSGQQASDLVAKRLRDDSPLMIARYGSTELHAIVASKNKARSSWKKYSEYIFSKTSAYTLRHSHIHRMHMLSGMFPESVEMIQRFYTLMMEDTQELDILGSWMSSEVEILKEANKKVDTIPLNLLEPYYHENPWSEALEGKKVLVIHPFAETIQQQYEKHRNKLFQDPRILPAFELQTIKAVQTIAGEKNPAFENWFEALDFMKDQINQLSFDVAIIGCGAYGFPLAAHVKRIGKKAIHMGGATQILFGIKGSRWDDHEVIGKLYNEYWTRPHASDRPKNSNVVEGSAYW